MAYDIRPLSFGEILDRAFRVYLDNFALLFGISAVVWIPSGILLLTASVIGAGAAAVFNLLFLSVAGPILAAAHIIAVSEVYLDRPITIAEAYRSTRPIILPLLGTYLLMGLLLFGPIALIFGVAYALSMPAFMLFAFPAGIAVMYFSISFALIGPVMIVERRFAMAALRRSHELISGSWWLTLGIMLTAGLIAQVPAAGLKFLWAFIPVIGVLLTALTQAVSSTYSSVAIVIYYFDRRCRTEDFDLRLLAEQVRAETVTMTPAPGSSSIA
ncbi:MAG TPA: hypothetical protein VKV03_14600 [Candidatus Binataceae bacterium]|nr:hypothetical protein [Candidatus Binataceae bacterium]